MLRRTLTELTQPRDIVDDLLRSCCIRNNDGVKSVGNLLFILASLVHELLDIIGRCPLLRRAVQHPVARNLDLVSPVEDGRNDGRAEVVHEGIVLQLGQIRWTQAKHVLAPAVDLTCTGLPKDVVEERVCGEKVQVSL